MKKIVSILIIVGTMFIVMNQFILNTDVFAKERKTNINNQSYFVSDYCMEGNHHDHHKHHQSLQHENHH